MQVAAVLLVVLAALIGVCANPDGPYNSTVRPALFLMGTLVAAIGRPGAVAWMRQREWAR